MMFPQSSQGRGIAPTHHATSSRRLYQRENVVKIGWFYKMTGKSCRPRTRPIRGATISGQRSEHRQRLQVAQTAGHGETIDTRQTEVTQHHIRPDCTGKRHTHLAILCQMYLMPAQLQKERKRAQRIGLIIDDQYYFRHGEPEAARSASPR